MSGIFLLLGLTALGLSWQLPGHYPPWTSFEAQLGAGAGAALIAAAALSGRPERLRMPALAWVSLALSAVPWLQWGVGQIRFMQDALMSSVFLAGFAVCVVAGANFAGRSRDDFLRGWSAMLIAAAIASGGLALFQWLGLGGNALLAQVPKGGRPFANLAQPNHLCTLLALGLVAAIGSFEGGRLGRKTLALATAFLTFCMVMTQSRTGWLVMALLSLWWLVSRRRAALKLSPAFVVVTAVGFVGAIVLWGPLNQALLLATESLGERLAPGTRFGHWQTLWDAARQAPWAGYGWHQVGLAQQAAALNHPATHEWLLDSHNLVLDLVLWNGIPLGLALVGLLVWWLGKNVAACRTAEQWTLLAGVGVILVHGMLEYPHAYTYFLLPLGLMMGALDGSRAPNSNWTLPRAACGSGLLALTCMLGWIGVEYLQAQTAATRLRFVTSGIGVDKVSTAPVPDIVLLDALREYHRFWLTPAIVGESPGQLAWQRDVARRYAVPPAMLRYALAAGLNDRPEEARITLALICKMHTEKRFEEGKDAWAQLQARYPRLQSIDLAPCS